MLRVIVYDICDPKRLRRVAKVCEYFAARVEDSVFECSLPDSEFERFRIAILRILDPEKDFLIVYPVCAACEEKILTEGQAVRPLKQTFFVY